MGDCQKLQRTGYFFQEGSDDIERIFAFEGLRLSADKEPYIYIWAGVPESDILQTANGILFRNLLLLSLATILALILSWVLGNHTLILPIKSLVALTKKITAGGLEQHCALASATDELGTLAKAFQNMADNLTKGQLALKENEARFRLVMDGLDSLVYVADMDTYEILFINEFGKKIFGEVTGKTCWQSIPENQKGPCSFCTNKSLLSNDGQPSGIHTWEFPNTIKNRWYYIQDRAIKWTDGRIVRLEIATDITERKMAETLLAEETERLAVTLQSIADGVITTDTKGRVILVNQIAEELTGWKSSAAAGRPLNEVFNTINTETTGPCESPVEKILAAGEVIDLAHKATLIDKSGREKFISDSGAPIKDKNGKIIGIVLVFRDISAQLRTEQELLKIKKLESIGVLAGGIAHDYNNLLTGILGNIDLSLRDSNLNQQTKIFLQQAQNASFRARDLTQQLLTFAKGGQPVKETASLTEVIKDSAEFAFHGNKVACRWLFPEDLWLVDIDKGQISQVIQNLIINASDAMPDGGIIEVSCENVSNLDCEDITSPVSNHYVKLSIKDRGRGIPADELEKIFDPYFTTKSQGSGLGLAITHSIVNNHSGSISVQSSFGVGTIFTICLPASAHDVLPVKKVKEVSVNKKNARIMVMDDEELVRNIAEAMLTATGHSVLLVKDGTEAVQKYKEAKDNNSPIDLIIMDLTIPGEMGGQEAVKEILTIDPEAKVIVSSGYSEDPAMAFFKDYGFCAALAKPFLLSELTRVINRFLD